MKNIEGLINEGVFSFVILELVFLLILYKIKMKFWFKILNLTVFMIYSFKSYISFFVELEYTGNWVIIMNAQFYILCHIVCLLMVKFYLQTQHHK
jgi:hypothetical protein